MTRAPAAAFIAVLGLGLPGCVGLRLDLEPDNRGRLLATQALQPPSQLDLGLVFATRRGAVIATDAASGRAIWRVKLPVSGSVVADRERIYVPLVGHGLAALDVRTGEMVWRIELPGEILIGLDASRGIVAVAVSDRSRARSRLLAFSAADGQIRWSRRSDGSFASPRVTAKGVAVHVGERLVLLRLHTGAERWRAPVALDSGSNPGDLLFVGGEPWLRSGTRWATPRSSSSAAGEVFTVRLDRAYDWDDTWLDRRTNILVVRQGRAFLGLALDDAGKPRSIEWGHLARRPVAAMKPVEHTVVVVDETGSSAWIDVDSGAIVRDVPGHDIGIREVTIAARPPKSSDRSLRSDRRARSIHDAVVRILLEPDPDVVDLQRLALAMLSNAGTERGAIVIDALASGRIRGESTPGAETLRSDAQRLVATTRAAPPLEGGAQGLERRPDFLAGEASPVALAAHTAAAGGHTHELANLAALLLHPSTTAVDVAAVARAIAELDDPAALAAASEFVRRYHADPSVVFESLAIFHCVDYLARRASSRDADKSDAARALEVLREVARDPFTEARLAAYIRRGLVPPSARVR